MANRPHPKITRHVASKPISNVFITDLLLVFRDQAHFERTPDRRCLLRHLLLESGSVPKWPLRTLTGYASTEGLPATEQSGYLGGLVSGRQITIRLRYGHIERA